MARTPLSILPIRTSCLLLQHGGVSILTDPWFASRMSGRDVIRKPAVALTALPPIDIVLASHLHSDHFELQAVAKLLQLNANMVVIGTCGTAQHCRQIEGLAVYDMRPWDELTIAGVSVMAIPAKHTGPPPREVNYVIELGGWRLFFGGDARFSEHFAELADRTELIDVAMLPVGGSEIWLKRTTMGPDDAVRACKVLKPRFALGIHEGGEWPAMLPLSRHPGRRADFDALLRTDDGLTQPIPAAPGQQVVLDDDGFSIL